jgi:5-formyltetrahydrofolate cyclo-ligase
MTDQPTKSSAKSDLRAAALARRAEMSAEASAAFAARLAEVGPQLAAKAGAKVAAAYWPIRSEASTLPLIEALGDQGLVTALPVLVARDEPLLFRAWKVGDPTNPGQMKIPEPDPSLADVTPDLLFIPLAAFDRSGNRLGYGAGFYDRTLEKLRANGRVTAIGIAYGCQETAAIPAEPHDQRLDFVLTERELIAIG